MSWAGALAAMVIASGVVAAALPMQPRDLARKSVWELPRIAQTFTPIVGSLAGFSIASTIFIANLAVSRGSAGFPSLIGMFVVAFVIFIGAAQEFGMTPNLPPGDDPAYERIQRLSYLLAMFGFHRAGGELERPADPAADPRPARYRARVPLGPAVRDRRRHDAPGDAAPLHAELAPTNDLLGDPADRPHRGRRLPAGPRSDDPRPRPAARRAVRDGSRGLRRRGAGFTLQSTMLSLHDNPRFEALLERHADRTVVAFLAMVSSVVGALWIVVALA